VITHTPAYRVADDGTVESTAITVPTRIDPRSVPVRFSRLKSIGRSPLHYRHALEEERADSASMRLGRLVHFLALGAAPDDGDGKIVVYEGERRGKVWQEFAAANEGADIVTVKELEAARPIAAAVLNDPIASQFLGERHEERVDWKIGDRQCTARLDIIGQREGRRFVCDLKTTRDAAPESFKRDAWRRGYAAQLAWYGDGLATAGEPVDEHYIIAVESAAPHPVTVLRLLPNLIEEGRRQYRAWFERLRVCEDSNDWPAYAQTVVDFDVPAWFEVGGEDEDDDEEAAQ